MRKLSYAALAAAVLFSRAATAHEFVCEKTINGEVVHEIKSYPEKLNFTVSVINTHPTDASTALSVRDDLMSSLGGSFTPAAPFTVAAGTAAEFSFEITVHDDAECRAFSRAQACAAGFEDLFEVTWESGVAQCAARLVCGHEAGGGGGDHGGGGDDHGGGGDDHGGGGNRGGGACTCDADCAGHGQCRNGKCEDGGGGGDHGGGGGDHGDDGEHGGGGKQGGGGDHDPGGDEHGGGGGDHGRGDDHGGHGGHDHGGGGNDDGRGGDRGKGGNR